VKKRAKKMIVAKLRKLVLDNAGLAGCNIPFHAANEDIYNISTGISNMWLAVQAGAWLGFVDSGVDELDMVLVYTSIQMYITCIYRYSTVCTCIYR
jgi:hypothetical protein